MQSYEVPPGAKVRLGDWDPGDKKAFPEGKDEAVRELAALRAKLDAFQELLYAEHLHKVLVLFQAMDTAGKDGTIRSVFEGVNPQGVKVVSFKVPTQAELDRDYLWRAHAQVPAKGEITVFNRSYYEDVLVVRVHELVPPKTWKRRYRQINDFERMLTEEGTTILKFFLHIDPDEQKARLQERLDEPRKRWKFSRADVEERKLWSSYMEAYEDALSETSTEWAPWRIIPSNHNWLRNLLVARGIVAALERLDMRYPEPPPDLEGVRIE